ncbi:hypothetical protein C8R45DRAFT_1110176 [Mycena sanguinolenta]|nr:hypothetical protein C8R45DRAFT_1110176 [Mycena sanguinolenta]
MHNGPNRASFMWGSSTRNTRIERLWIDVGTQFVRYWRAFFIRLELRHYLDVDKPEHLWLLHILFLDYINEDCAEFQANWNAHPMKTSSNKSPNSTRTGNLLGQVQHRVYINDCQGLHPETIEKYYGVPGAKRVGPAGAGNPQNKQDAEEDDIAEHIRADQGPHIRHDAIEVPDQRNPFSGDPQAETHFFAVLTNVVGQDIIPAGYGVLPEERDEDGYPDVEFLAVGKRMKTQIPVSLASPIWLQRARLWVQALKLLGYF